MKKEIYICTACGNAKCTSEPKSPWGKPETCLYDTQVPVNWQIKKLKSRNHHANKIQRTKSKARRS